MADNGLQPTAVEAEILHRAADLSDAIEDCKVQVKQRGPLVESKAGSIKANPAVSAMGILARQQADLMARIDTAHDSSEQARKDPVKVRAAQARWSRGR